MKLLPRLVLVLAGLTLAFALASCGDSDDGDGTTAASDAATESEAAEGAEGGAEWRKDVFFCDRLKPVLLSAVTG